MSLATEHAERPLLAELGLAVAGRTSGALQRALTLADRHLGAHPAVRSSAILLVYALLLGASFHLAYELRWDFAPPLDFEYQRAALLIPVVACKVLLLHSFGQFRSILSYFSLADLGAVVLATGTVSLVMYALWFGSAVAAAPPRGVVLIDFILSVATLSAFRLSLRVARSRLQVAPGTPPSAVRRAAIIGAGDLAEAVAKDLLQRGGSGLVPVFLLDDDGRRVGRTVHGLPVYGPLAQLPVLASRARVTELIVALAETPPKRLREIVELGRSVGANTQVVPSITQLASGAVKVERSRPVLIEDLLGRAPVNLDSDAIAGLLRDQVVLVTGAGGSIGSELCRQILARGPRQLVLVDQAEIAMFEIEQELRAAGAGARLAPRVADVGDETALRALLAAHRPALVFHAAAHKHVPLMERQPAEALKNNTLATATLARLAREHGVARFVFISTDKAINPTSVMGCSKRLAERFLQAEQAVPGNRTEFLAVRFGNVLGSSGSVIPVFRRQIAAGGPVTVTHPDMTRYFMTIPEAVGLVLQTAVLGRGGDIYILDMREPVRIYDMARQMIELSGYRPDVDIDIVITGLRPGEKLFEELRHSDETHALTEHPRIFRLRTGAEPVDTGDWRACLQEAAHGGDPAAIKRLMKALVPEYTPFAD